MTNRHGYHKRTGKDVRSRGRYVSLTEYMLASPSWHALDGNSRALYIELTRRYRGPNSNNGKIPYSVREAAAALNIGRSTAQRCFQRLTALGFIKIGKRSGFSMKGRVSTEWLLTEFPDDTQAKLTTASKDFMRWTPENSFHSPTSDTHSPTSGPPMVLRRARVA
jgi:DNA-binding transcriptional MocR family regulator